MERLRLRCFRLCSNRIKYKFIKVRCKVYEYIIVNIFRLLLAAHVNTIGNDLGIVIINFNCILTCLQCHRHNL